MPSPEDLLALMPYAARLGIRLSAASARETVGHLDWSADLCTAGGILHGGVIMSLADTVGAVCAYLNLPEGAGAATIDSTTRLFRPVSSGTVHATARPASVGRSVIVVNTELRDDEDRLVAETSQAQAVIAER